MIGLDDVVPRVRSSLVPVWHEVRYRRKRARTEPRRVSVDENPLISMICVSNRPAQLEHIIATWKSQQLVATELVLVTNADGYAPAARARLADDTDATVVETDPALTLGAALNKGIEHSKGTVVAKFDDDDYYAPNYLRKSVDLLRKTRAGVVGKKAHFVYLAASDQTILRVPNGEYQRVGRVAGGTLVMLREVLDEVPFPDRTLGEDTEFTRQVEAAGWAVFSGGASGYLQIRGEPDDHTWGADGEELLRRARLVGPGNSTDYWCSP